MYIKIKFGTALEPADTSRGFQPVFTLNDYCFYGYDVLEVADEKEAEATTQEAKERIFEEIIPDGTPVLYKGKPYTFVQWCGWKEIPEEKYNLLQFH